VESWNGSKWVFRSHVRIIQAIPHWGIPRPRSLFFATISITELLLSGQKSDFQNPVHVPYLRIQVVHLRFTMANFASSKGDKSSIKEIT
jgi:hypothetical protein